jgi:hypothetical protein
LNRPVAAPGRELFVYYRVAEATLDSACAAALAMQADLCAAYPGLQARLLRRPEAADGRCTLMETYACTAGVGAALQTAIDQAAGAALASWQLGERHTEVFRPCA